MDFLGIAGYLFDLLIMQLLPFASTVLLIIMIFGVINRLPDTITNYAKKMGGKLSRSLKGKKR